MSKVSVSSSIKRQTERCLRKANVCSKQKGKKEGFCNRLACLSPDNILYFNLGTRAYYCETCAREIQAVNPEFKLFEEFYSDTI